ncbi:hypothetical protein [Clostridium sp. AF32-12BH]|uniref:hypothetical protein n=1 Tax=Clostridium sp. AF32-12BH TaxID=2292006 RepID=UPI000E513383|nr:hypothetical protein [Clostridium sp. AF32-12BH]RHP47023.1 hypothetical protein DWZ40_08955 [Clostridium sp. AF32-12BH]
MRKIKGLRKALKDYKEANRGGCFSPWYAFLMFDKADGSVWTDIFYDLGHNSYKLYYDDSIINLGASMNAEGLLVNADNVKRYLAAMVA